MPPMTSNIIAGTFAAGRDAGAVIQLRRCPPPIRWTHNLGGGGTGRAACRIPAAPDHAGTASALPWRDRGLAVGRTPVGRARDRQRPDLRLGRTSR